MTRSGYLLEVSAPAHPTQVDRFVARHAEAVARWLSWAFAGARGVRLTELALEERLVVQLRVIDGTQLAAAVDLRRWCALEVASAAPVRLSSSAALATLRRRLERRPELHPTLAVDQRGLCEALPELPVPTWEPGSVLTMQAPVGALRFGDNLVDSTEQADDPDPPLAREVPLPPQSAPLFEAVWAAPEDDDARAVLADCLEEAGHPWGTFLRLQLARAHSGAAPDREERALLEQHEASWLGDLGRVLTQVQWARGFPLEATLTDHVPGLLRRPALATLRRLRMNDAHRERPLSLDALHRLKVITHAGRNALASLTTGRFTALEALNCGGGLLNHGVPVAALAALAEGQGLPALKWLEIDDGTIETETGGRLLSGPGRFIDASDFEWLWRTPLGQRLRRFGTVTTFEALGPWLRRAAGLTVPVLTFRVCQYLTYESLWLRLDAGVLRARFRQVPAAYDDGRDTVGLLLAALGDGPLQQVRLEHPHPEQLAPAHRADARLVLVPPGPIDDFVALGVWAPG